MPERSALPTKKGHIFHVLKMSYAGTKQKHVCTMYILMLHDFWVTMFFMVFPSLFDYKTLMQIFGNIYNGAFAP